MPSHLSLRTLPILDLGGTHPDTLRVIARDTGAFLLTGHGIRPEVPDEVVDLARLFFALPDRDKAAVAAAGSEQFRGWTAFGTGRDLGRREQFDIGAELPAVPVQDRTHPGDALVGPNRWPARLPALRDRALWFQDRATEVARAVLRQLAVGLGQDCEVFDRALAGSPATWTTLARDGGASGAGSAIPAHTDAGILTLHWLDARSTGLQVLADHRWVDATGAAGGFLVTIGESLADATDGYLRAAPYRMLPAQAERVTLTYAFDAPVDATVPHLDLPAGFSTEWAQAA